MEAQLRDVETKMFERSAHMTMIDQPNEMIGDLVNWWTKVECKLQKTELTRALGADTCETWARQMKSRGGQVATRKAIFLVVFLVLHLSL